MKVEVQAQSCEKLSTELFQNFGVLGRAFCLGSFYGSRVALEMRKSLQGHILHFIMRRVPTRTICVLRLIHGWASVVTRIGSDHFQTFGDPPDVMTAARIQSKCRYQSRSQFHFHNVLTAAAQLRLFA